MNKSWWWLAAFIIIGVLLVAGVLFLVTRPSRGEAIKLMPPPTAAPIKVYVSGAVNTSGLYTLPPGSRVNDAIQAAGGFTSDANTSLLNLAKFLDDGDQVEVPALSPVVSTPDPSRSPPERGNEFGIPAITIIDINTATLEQLETLPEIGPMTAQAIIDFRNAHGPFKSIEAIVDVDGIGQATFDKIKDLIMVGIEPR